jgi:hypothetical protein
MRSSHASCRNAALTVIVPRHPQRFAAVADLLRRRGKPFVLRSSNAPVTADVEVVLGDSMGEMAAYYAAADIAFVGGSLLPLGGQNLIEPIGAGRPTLVGPHMFNFADATRKRWRPAPPSKSPMPTALVATVADSSPMRRAGRRCATPRSRSTPRIAGRGPARCVAPPRSTRRSPQERCAERQSAASVSPLSWRFEILDILIGQRADRSLSAARRSGI